MVQLTPLAILKQLLAEQLGGTQAELGEMLRLRGVVITQSQVSRLLRKLGAMKIINEKGQTVYSLGKEVAPVNVSSLASMVVEIVNNESLIVIHTSPGSAPLVAGRLDQNAKALHILGTVAGDDTLFVAPASLQKMAEIKRMIEDFFELSK